jgi:hypothetical protein
MANTETPRKSKIDPVRVASDDCAISVGRVMVDGVITEAGTQNFVHKGEWVDIIPVQTMRETMAITRLMGGGESESTIDAARRLTAPFEELCEVLAKRVMDWNWTDNWGDPMPNPQDDPGVLRDLSNDELFWLIGAAQNGAGTDRKHDSTP